MLEAAITLLIALQTIGLGVMFRILYQFGGLQARVKNLEDNINERKLKYV